MKIRVPPRGVFEIDNLSLTERRSKANLYPTAYPFSKSGLDDSPSPIAFCTLAGYAAAVTTLQDLRALGGSRPTPSAGFTVGVSSGNAADTALGTGARTVEVDAIDTDGVPRTIPLALAGQTKVSDTLYVGKIIRIVDVRIMTFGTGLANAGIVYVYDASDTVTAGVPQTAGKIFDSIPVGENQCRNGYLYVPKGCKAMVYAVRAGFNDQGVASRAANVSMSVRSADGSVRQTPIIGQIVNSGPVSVTPDFPFVLDEKSELTLRAVASASSTLAAFVDVVLYHK